jgi:hypothetical protein
MMVGNASGEVHGYQQPIDCRDAMVLLVGVLCGLLAKALPKVHGNKLTVEHTGAGFKACSPRSQAASSSLVPAIQRMTMFRSWRFAPFVRSPPRRHRIAAIAMVPRSSLTETLGSK